MISIKGGGYDFRLWKLLGGGYRIGDGDVGLARPRLKMTF